MHWQIFFSCPIRIWKVYGFLFSKFHLLLNIPPSYIHRFINFRKFLMFGRKLLLLCRKISKHLLTWHVKEISLFYFVMSYVTIESKAYDLSFTPFKLSHNPSWLLFLRRFTNIPTLFLGSSKLIKNKFVYCVTLHYMRVAIQEEAEIRDSRLSTGSSVGSDITVSHF